MLISYRRWEHLWGTALLAEGRGASRNEQIRDHLRQPFKGYGTTDVMLPQFAEVALSHMACGLQHLLEADVEDEISHQRQTGEQGSDGAEFHVHLTWWACGRRVTRRLYRLRRAAGNRRKSPG